MTVSRNLTEAQRWLKQALHDRDAARLNREHGFHEHACFLAQQSAEKALKAFPDAVPHDFYDRSLADQAVGDLDAVIACVQQSMSPEAPCS